MQYLIQQEEQTVEYLALHGNSKRKQPYRRLLPSTQDKLKQSTESLKNPNEVLDEIYPSSDDDYHARSFSQPRVRETSTTHKLQPKKFSSQSHGMLALKSKIKCG